MNKQDFIRELNDALSGLPDSEREDRVLFYGEMIDDLVEEGLSEEEAVSQIGSVKDVTAQIVADIPLSKIVKARMRREKKFEAWEIVLLIVGAPLWISLLVAAFAVVISLFASVWAVIISLWAVFSAIVGCAIGGTVAGVLMICHGNPWAGIAVIGAAIACAGLSIFMFFGCLEATKGFALFIKKIILSIKKRFVRKEKAR